MQPVACPSPPRPYAEACSSSQARTHGFASRAHGNRANPALPLPPACVPIRSMGSAAILLTNKRSERRRAKYELQHVVRVHLGSDDAAYK